MYEYSRSLLTLHCLATIESIFGRSFCTVPSSFTHTLSLPYTHTLTYTYTYCGGIEWAAPAKSPDLGNGCFCTENFVYLTSSETPFGSQAVSEGGQ